MEDYDKNFIDTFNEYYPFERYIFEEPKSIDNLFDDLLLTEIFIPKTEIKPICNDSGDLLYWTSINKNDIYIKVKTKDGSEIRLGYFDFESHIRENIRDIFVSDFGDYEYECLYVDHEDKEDLNKRLAKQKELIESKYSFQ